MPYQYVREPLTADESIACPTPARRPPSGSSSGPCSTPGSASASCAASPRRTSSGSSASSGSKARAAPTARRPRSAWCRCRNRVRTLLEHHFALEKAFPVKTRRAQDIVKAVADRAGITRDVSPHVLRHTFATTALQKGISLPTVQKILGHDQSPDDGDLPQLHRRPHPGGVRAEVVRTGPSLGCPANWTA